MAPAPRCVAVVSVLVGNFRDTMDPESASIGTLVGNSWANICHEPLEAVAQRRVRSRLPIAW